MPLRTVLALCMLAEAASQWIKDEAKARPDDPRKAVLNGQYQNSI
jgi:hypothetical protein